MARRRSIVIDGKFRTVKEGTKLSQVVSPETRSVSTTSGQIIPRAEFDRVELPDGFETNLTAQRKG